MKNIRLLSKGLFETQIMDSKVKSKTVSSAEKIIGHMIAPLGLVMLVNTIAALVELFFTEQVPLDTLYGTGTYLRMTVIARILGTGMGLLTGWAIQHTVSRQGKIRPWHLICGCVSILTGLGLFIVPDISEYSYLAYVYSFFIVYNVVGLAFYYLFNSNIVSLSTRNFSERTSIQFFRKIGWTLISGILIGLVITSVVYYSWLINNRDAWWQLIAILTVAAIPLLLLEYYYTRERVTEDVAERTGDAGAAIPLKHQITSLLTNKYYVLMLVGTTIGAIVDNLKGGNVTTNFCRWVLGADAENNIQMIYTILSGAPMSIGLIIVYPLAKKFGIRNLSLLGFSMVVGGSVLGLFFPTNVIIAYVAGFIKNMGLIPNGYIFAALLGAANDSVEHKSGFRPEGILGAAIIGLIQSLIYVPFTGSYETMLIASGFNASLTYQPDSVINWVSFAFYGFDLIFAGAWVLILPFMDLEKKMPQINADLLERKKQAVLARGEVWIDPDEQERLEREQQAEEFERNRISDLRSKCLKKGLDFETENNKYLAKLENKNKKAALKNEAKNKN
jgi:GPH family glycoside/pentoside/hexuronide:cation symporter